MRNGRRGKNIKKYYGVLNVDATESENIFNNK